MANTLRRNRVQIITLLALGLFLLLASQGMSTKDWVITLLRGLATGAITFLVASGFSIILGLMDVLNLAHGALYMIGAYVGWSVYVRPDVFVDLLMPLALIGAGFALYPVLGYWQARLPLGPTLRRAWPWVGLSLALFLLGFLLRRAPIALWDAEVYTDSPIVWTQAFEQGRLAEVIAPAAFQGLPSWLGLGGIFIGGVLLSASLAGLGQRPGSLALPAPARRRAVLLAGGLVLVGLAVHGLNEPLTALLLGMDATGLFLLAAVVATLVGAGLGALTEMALIRPLYERPIYQILLTFGLAFILTEMVRSIWGRPGFTMPRPPLFAGAGEGCPATSLGAWLESHCAIIAVEIGGETARIRTYNEIFVTLVGLLVLVSVWLLLQRTRLGMIIRAGVQDREMVEALGINVRRVFTLVFALGVGLAALGGVIGAPATGLSLEMGASVLLAALIALAVGGLTSYPGAAAGAVLVGLLQQFIIKYGATGIQLPFMTEPFKPSPSLVPASTVLLMVVVLLLMPQGLFGRKE